MNNEPDYSEDIMAAALKVFTRQELREMSEPSLLSLGSLIRKRLVQPGPPPTLAELEGIRELVMDYLYPAAFEEARQLAYPQTEPEDKVTQAALIAEALKVCTREELTTLPETRLLSFFILIEDRLTAKGPPPTVEELQATKHRVLNLLTPEELETLSGISRDSPTQPG